MLVSEVVDYIQFDRPVLLSLSWTETASTDKQAGLDPVRTRETRLRETTPRCRRSARQRDACAHVCRGNSRSRWYKEGGYDAIAENFLDFWM